MSKLEKNSSGVLKRVFLGKIGVCKRERESGCTGGRA